MSNLAPAANPALELLDCNGTRVATLAPLAACASLLTLDCSNSGVAELDPLAACTMLQTLYCRFTQVGLRVQGTGSRVEGAVLPLHTGRA